MSSRSTRTMTRYYYAGGQRVAVRNSDGTGTDGLVFLINDHLGSTSLSSDPLLGQKLTELRYMPWGENRASGFFETNMPTDNRFTGQKSEMAALGLYFYNARMYDPALGRFISADTLIPEPYDSQSWDRYAAMVNNPVRFTDPTGHKHDPGGGTWGMAPDKDKYKNAGKNKLSQPSLLENTPNQETQMDGNGNELNNLKCQNTLCIPTPPPPVECNPCLSSWEQPSYWDTNPQNPDYYTLGIYPGLPGVPLGGSITVTIDRYGQVYFGLGLNGGKTIASPSISITGGYIGSGGDINIPDQGNMPSFLTGWAGNFSAGVVGGGGVSWSPGAGPYIDHVAWEFGGILPASIGVSVTYGWQIY